MLHRHDDGYPDERAGFERRAAPADPACTRRIDCADSPRARERFGSGRGRGGPDPEAYAARPGGPGTH